MKVMTLCTRYGVGGAELNSLLLSNELKKRGHEVISCFIFYSGEMHGSSGNEVIFSSRASVTSFFVSLFSFFKFARRFKPDCVVGFHPLANIYLGIFSLFFKCKFIPTQRNPSESMSWYTKYLDMFFGCFVSDEIVCVSNSVLKSFSKYPKVFRDKLSVIYNGIELKSNASADAQRNGEKIKVGFIGRVDVQKNPLVIPDVCSLVNSKSVVKFEFIVAGNGPLMGQFKDKVSKLNLDDYFVFLGELNPSDVASFYESIDILFMPSLYEGFGRTLVESMCFGNLMVLNDIDVFQEIASDTAFISENNALSFSDALISASEALLSNDFLALKSRIHDRANLFSIKSMIDSYESVILH